MAKAVAGKLLDIPEIELQEIIVQIEGLTPLICNRFSERAKAAIEDKQTGTAKAGRAFRNPEQEFRDSLYVIDADTERYGFPALGIKDALVNSGRVADIQMTKLRAALNIRLDRGQTLLEIKDSQPRMRCDFGRLQGKTMIPAYRAEFDPWRIEVPVRFVKSMVGVEQIATLFRIAGFSVGIGQWRPEKDGTFGQFDVTGVWNLGDRAK